MSEAYTAHDVAAGVDKAAAAIESFQRGDGEGDLEFASRLQAAAAALTRPEGTKGPDDAHWGEAARRERGAHPDDNPEPSEDPAQLIDAESGKVLAKDATVLTEKTHG